MNKIVSIVLILVIIVGLGWLLVRGVQNRLPDSPDLSVSYDQVSQEHIGFGDEHGPYNSNPPSSGPHIGETTAGLGFYDATDTTPTDELIIHNLEHGEIWLAYRPTLSESVISQLKSLSAEEPWLIVTPRAANDKDIAIVAWTRVDKFDLTDGALGQDGLDRLRGFITRYKDRGPEKVSPESHRQK